jgi:hypothetical protein
LAGSFRPTDASAALAFEYGDAPDERARFGGESETGRGGERVHDRVRMANAR